MKRIDTPTAVKDKFGPGKNGFTDGDPTSGRRATNLTADFFDNLQEEICRVIEKAGLQLDGDKKEQLWEAIIKAIGKTIKDNALLKDNYLSEILNAGTEAQKKAHENLGLGRLALVDSLSPVDVGAYPVKGGELNGEIWVKTGNNYRIVSGDTGAFWRYDGKDFYLMFTNSGDPLGNWNNLRPLRVDRVTGSIFFEHGVNSSYSLNVLLGGVGTGFYWNGDIIEQGNVNSIFRGYWGAISLNGALRAITDFATKISYKADEGWNIANQAWNKAEDAQMNRLSDSAMGAEGSFILPSGGGRRVPGGCAMTGWQTEGQNPGGDTIFYRPLMKHYPSIGWVIIGHFA